MAKIIAFEGLDCCFKETNAKKLYRYLKDKGYRVKLFSFPNYGAKSAYFVEEYLKGAYSKNSKDLPYRLTSLFFSLDRYDTYKKEIEPICHEMDYIIFDRYTGSNAIYQSANIQDLADRDEYIRDLIDLENKMMGLPRASITLYMNVLFDTAIKLMKEKSLNDINESDIEYQKRAYVAGHFMCSWLGWKRIDCVQGGKILSEDEIFNIILNQIQEIL